MYVDVALDFWCCDSIPTGTFNRFVCVCIQFRLLHWTFYNYFQCYNYI